jgi:AraC-like DNA-binding protein
VEDTKHRKASVRSRRSLAQGVVRVGPLMGVPAVLCELGQEPGPIFDSAGLQPAQFADADHEISYVAASRLLARCVAATGCQHFGLLVGKRADPSSLGVAGFMLRSAPDVGTALRGLVQHLDLHDQGGVPTLLIKGSLTLLGYAIHQSGTEATDQIYDLSVAIGCNIMRGLCGESWKPTEILLSRRPPLDLQITTADPLLHRHLEKQASELQALRHASITGDLRGLLRKSLLAHKCTASDVARQLCIHERTLNRKLQQQGTSFRRALDDTRCEMARQLLADSAMPLAKIANTLNYADASAFSRAFKRWMGVTPAQWRTQNASSP